MIRMWYVEEPGKYTHENGRSLGMFKYESSAKIHLEQLNKIPGNDKRTFVINYYDEPISNFPEWSWVWNTSEEEEHKMLRGEQLDKSSDKFKALFCEAITLLKEIAESRGQFYSEEEHTDYFKRVDDVIKSAEEMEN